MSFVFLVVYTSELIIFTSNSRSGSTAWDRNPRFGGRWTAVLAHVVCALMVFGTMVGSRGLENCNTRLLETAHYDLYVDNVDPTEFGLLLEQLHSKLSRIFGTQPRERLRVRILSSQQRYREILTKDLPANALFTSRSAGGCYVASNHTVYAWLQGSADATRSTLLHECTHQFHRLAITNNQRPHSARYAEGIAEFFAIHRWDNRTLIIQPPDIATDDMPARAAERFDQVWKGNFTRLATSAEPVQRDAYPDAWGLVGFLIHLDWGTYLKWSRLLDSGMHAGEAWQLTFGKTRHNFDQEYRAWLQQRQSRWRAVFGSWQSDAGTFEGRATTGYAVAVRKDGLRHISARVHPEHAGVCAGLVFNYLDDDNFDIVQVVPNKAVELRHVRGKKDVGGTELAVGIVNRDMVWDLSVLMSGDQYIIQVQGNELIRCEGVGTKLGLVVSGGSADFSKISDE